MVVGMTQMRKRRVVVRQLSALEALGGVTNICSDKTGTLTQGQMVTRKAWIPGAGIYSVSGSDDASNPTRGIVTLDTAPTTKEAAEAQLEERREERDRLRSTAGQSEIENEKTSDLPTLPEVGPELEAFLQSAALCNLASVRQDEQSGEWKTIGDPTEVALQVFAHRLKHDKKSLEAEGKWKQLAEFPFDSTVKRMSVIYKHGEDQNNFIFTKGAVERIIDLCVNVGVGEHQYSMTTEAHQQIIDQMDILAGQGLRVLAIARKTDSGNTQDSSTPREEIEKDLTLLGLVGLYDPPRLETKSAIKGMTPESARFYLDLITDLIFQQNVPRPVSACTCSQATTLPLPLPSPKKLVFSLATWVSCRKMSLPQW